MKRSELVIRFGIQQGLHWMIVGLLIPVITLIFQSRGLNLTEIGFVMAVWIGSTAILEIPLGGVADTFGRKNTYLFSLALNLLGCLALFYASSLGDILVSAIFLGASRAVYSDSLDAWFYDSFVNSMGEYSYHAAIAKINVLVTVGLATGSLIGGVLPNSIVSSYIETFSVYDINIFVASLSSIALFFLTWVLLPEQKNIKENTQNTQNTIAIAMQTSITALTVSLNQWTLRLLLQATFVFGAVMSAVESFWQPYLADLIGAAPDDLTLFGIISALYFLMSALSSVLSIPLLKIFFGSHKALIFTTRSLAGFSLLLLANATNTTSFSSLYLTFFFLFTMGNNSEQVLLNENTQEEIRATTLSISSFAVTCGGMFASLTMGVISEHFGISISWILCGSILLISSLYFLVIREVSRAEST
ncbi:MFS transporter [Salinivibrio sp. ES.052]|uniref:MFS transporter n=1 Tax=Salinivibrio sp. ES.052 TaxID=1882823 RepID=UPI0009411638|nr:MFS transporter [Salinivibrio sp. ES.052]